MELCQSFPEKLERLQNSTRNSWNKTIATGRINRECWRHYWRCYWVPNSSTTKRNCIKVVVSQVPLYSLSWRAEDCWHSKAREPKRQIVFCQPNSSSRKLSIILKLRWSEQSLEQQAQHGQILCGNNGGTNIEETLKESAEDFIIRALDLLHDNKCCLSYYRYILQLMFNC